MPARRVAGLNFQSAQSRAIIDRAVKLSTAAAQSISPRQLCVEVICRSEIPSKEFDHRCDFLGNREIRIMREFCLISLSRTLCVTRKELQPAQSQPAVRLIRMKTRGRVVFSLGIAVGR